MNGYNEYGYDEGVVTLTIPEETRQKWSEWKEETHNWRDYIEEHIDDKHAETQAHVTSETNRAIGEVKTAITSARDYVVNDVNTRATEIKTKIDSSSTVIDNIWSKVSSMTYYR